MYEELTTPEFRVFNRFLIAHAALMRGFEARLHAEHGISMAWFDALVQISLEKDQRITHTRLGERKLVSQGGITRLVDRMAKAGLVARRSSRADRRTSYIVLTDEGRKKLAEVMPTQLESVNKKFVTHMRPDEVDVLGSFFSRVLGEDESRWTAGDSDSGNS